MNMKKGARKRQKEKFEEALAHGSQAQAIESFEKLSKTAKNEAARVWDELSHQIILGKHLHGKDK